MAKNITCWTLAHEVLNRAENDYDKAIKLCQDQLFKYVCKCIRKRSADGIIGNIMDLYRGAIECLRKERVNEFNSLEYYRYESAQ